MWHNSLAVRGSVPAVSNSRISRVLDLLVRAARGSCNLCGQYGHFARVCPSAGSQQTAAQPQGRGGQSRGRYPQF
ncbi:actin-depolymerizing factor [Dorcoceras hygrometricum]|uniref:Actin-depolymerizing factor n=1 Tax=Dorcoceras hygrometricum TaxID=472368 RepID=A0A2Z7CUL1_9LAMI|nr:actin-depolymerizing factor [Dorcoceras hygrometricum]